MLRIYFTSADIARVRLAPTADPLWETILSIHMLRGQRGDLLFTEWRRTTAGALREAGLGPAMGLLSSLTPTMGYFPDFLNPIVPGHRLEDGLERMRSTPVAVLDRDLRRMGLPEHVQAGVRRIAEGSPAALRSLTDTILSYYQRAIEPHRRVVEAAVEHDRSVRIRTMADGGVARMLDGLRPMIEYSDGELRVPSHPDQEIHLGGRGLLLIPAYFGVNHPMTMFEESADPVLVYPVERRFDLLPDTASERRSGLAALIGQTRASLLYATAGDGRSTTDLARRVGISVASASEQTSVLREAGLLTSRRDGNRMVHQLTALGEALLYRS
ncbi:MAG: winged helix-turn-helix transcriptional regulator [Hamadaea sp.]|uniref:ArsR/SmtB family transcription factor n=1 Tax=Hamadaea sp. TaxID=2024425 RepID=UPI0018449FB2|nr:winged helix-turn-helix domain-containing protein [Hamadaea sp.]NUR73926.1 winged helix-turn-helix transcriptional regulator [Hamadaea sp.]NUT19599.1 winged helix-turn-helix transcriptional regulator [Hamadaea sp.]